MLNLSNLSKHANILIGGDINSSSMYIGMMAKRSNTSALISVDIVTNLKLQVHQQWESSSLWASMSAVFTANMWDYNEVC